MTPRPIDFSPQIREFLKQYHQAFIDWSIMTMVTIYDHPHQRREVIVRLAAQQFLHNKALPFRNNPTKQQQFRCSLENTLFESILLFFKKKQVFILCQQYLHFLCANDIKKANYLTLVDNFKRDIKIFSATIYNKIKNDKKMSCEEKLDYTALKKTAEKSMDYYAASVINPFESPLVLFTPMAALIVAYILYQTITALLNRCMPGISMLLAIVALGAVIFYVHKLIQNSVNTFLEKTIQIHELDVSPYVPPSALDRALTCTLFTISKFDQPAFCPSAPALVTSKVESECTHKRQERKKEKTKGAEKNKNITNIPKSMPSQPEQTRYVRMEGTSLRGAHFLFYNKEVVHEQLGSNGVLIRKFDEMAANPVIVSPKKHGFTSWRQPFRPYGSNHYVTSRYKGRVGEDEELMVYLIKEMINEQGKKEKYYCADTVLEHKAIGRKMR